MEPEPWFRHPCLHMSDAVIPSNDAFVGATQPLILDFDTFYAEQYRRMVRLAFVLVDTHEEAEEVVQDAFVAIVNRFARLDNPAAYLRRCVLNRAGQLLRRRRILRRQPEIRIEDSELGFNHLVDAVRRLPNRQRSVVVLRFEGQLTDAEIAETLRMPIGIVKSTLHRAIARLRLEVET
jgi:RNA polymerase sigma factor (sigma-70 family)